LCKVRISFPMELSPQLLQQMYSVKILEQPAPKALRFRYECEGRSAGAGSLPGATSSHDKKTFPKIQVNKSCSENWQKSHLFAIECVRIMAKCAGF
jgi:hypothetical protein